jgi:uncharacterized membrane protein YozB (DUF420 family)
VTISDLPHVNAALNFTSAVLLVVGYAQIRRKRVAAHRACMLSATLVSAAFLTCYLIYTTPLEASASRDPAFAGDHDDLRVAHALALAVPFSSGSPSGAPSRRFVRHRRIARLTFRSGSTSAAGVVVYLMLYQIFPGSTPR